MLKQLCPATEYIHYPQPPSGGCVLKQFVVSLNYFRRGPAAFGRLCVETRTKAQILIQLSPAAFGRLCVETTVRLPVHRSQLPAAFGRLCVETQLP